MHFITGFLNLLAEDAPAVPADGAPGQNPAPPSILWIVVPIFALWMLLMRPNKKAEQAQKAMLNNLKQNDRVLTVSGIYGIVTNVQRDADRVTLRIDETNNTKINVTVASIARVLVDTPEADKDKPK